MAISPTTAAAIWGGIGQFAGAVVGGAVNRRERIAAENQTRKLRKEDRDWFEKDRTYSRDAFIQDRDNDRAYQRSVTADDRAHAARLLAEDRAYVRDNFVADRNYDRNIAVLDRENERQYLARRLQEDRAYSENQGAIDRALYNQDQLAIMRSQNKLAEKSAASRGIDFVKLRDDAVKAGYNPMTALSMAHAYSTHVDYADNRSAYGNGPAFQVQGAGYNAQGGGGGGAGTSAAPMSAPIPTGQVAAGSFSSPGAGYSAHTPPSMSSGAFVAEAVARGVDSWFNRPPEKDALAESLKNAFALAQQQEADERNSIPKGFGYDLTAARPFKPAGKLSTPALAPAAELTATHPGGPVRNPYRGNRPGLIPVFKPDGSEAMLDASIARRLDIKRGDTVSAGDWAEIAGEVIGETQNTMDAPAIYEQATGSPLELPVVGEGARRGRNEVRIKPGSANRLTYGSRKFDPVMRNPKPKPGWMNEAYGSSW